MVARSAPVSDPPPEPRRPDTARTPSGTGGGGGGGALSSLVSRPGLDCSGLSPVIPVYRPIRELLMY